MSKCPSLFHLVQSKVGELDENRSNALKNHLQSCVACQKVMAEIERNQAYYLYNQNQHLALLRARLSLEQPAAPNGRSWIRFAVAMGGVITICAAAFLLIPRSTQPLEEPHKEASIAFKGTMSFEVIAKRGQRQFRVEEGAELMPGDALRFVVTVGIPGYLAVFSIDSRTRISAFYPDSDATKYAEPMLLQRKGRHELPGSIILDQVHGDECIVVAFSERPFDRSQIQQQARQAKWFKQMGSPNESNADSDIQLGVLWVKKK